MDANSPQVEKPPREIMRSIVDLCADCDTCRPLMDEACLFFPELYRLWDQEKETGRTISDDELRSLTDLCTYCGVCPCPRIPADVMVAKGCYIDKERLPLHVKILTDVPRLAQICGLFPRLTNAFQSKAFFRFLTYKLAHIHTSRSLPSFPEENFFDWAKKKDLTTNRAGEHKVSYFFGCSVGYLFPEVGKATVQVLKHNNITVYVPTQDCCGFPHLVDGAREDVFGKLQTNMENIKQELRSEETLICTCPTCGYFMKTLLRDRAYYSSAYQTSVNAGPDELKLPEIDPKTGNHKILKKSIYKNILKDDGYFSSLDPLARIQLSDKISDAGHYLHSLFLEGQFNTKLRAISERMVYFAPCHQRQQKIESPYFELLSLIPGLKLDCLEGMYCCGMGGNFGFKSNFHEKSLLIGEPLFKKIREKSLQAIITDCMSCKLQFVHVLPYPVYHPMEILAKAYQD
ncbi:MAG: FeS-binding protein [Deltaproteobacteria bacterium]|jgi:glycerol-3-phosphate dehydrogenase subunit C|nr:FeS-binding protein [Deltaproteobacteria bacterium]